MKTRAYIIDYLDDAMSALGAMLDYAVNTCGEDLELFYARFLSSGIATQFAHANPKYLGGMSGIELAMHVARRTGDELPGKDKLIDMGSPEYWTGWTMAYLSWYLNLDFVTLQSRGLEIQEVYARYPVLHEADLSKTVSFASRRLSTANGESPLKRARRNAGLTQKELASLSGTTLRVIRAYEQGKRSLENAGAESVLRLSRVLGCPVEAFMPMDTAV